MSFSLAIKSPFDPFQASAPSVFSVEPISPNKRILIPLPLILVGLVLVGSLLLNINSFVYLIPVFIYEFNYFYEIIQGGP